MIAVSGSATLAGALNVALVGSFRPVVGNSFTVLTFGSRSGDFSMVNGLTLPNGLVFNRYFGATNMTLTAAHPLVAAAPALVETQEQLSSGDLTALYEAAVGIWEANGLPQQLVNRLRSVEFVIADLTDRTLAASVELTIAVDHNAAGHGWFVDQTPDLDEKFSTTTNDNVLSPIAGTLAYGRIDLLTVILHEQAHILGLDHSNDEDAAALMFATLATGTRRKLDPSIIDAILATNG